MPKAAKTPEAAASAGPIVLDLPEFGEEISYTGESVKIPRLEVPLIRISYKDEGDPDRLCPKGEFVEYNPATKETRAIGKTIKVQVLHHRQSLSAYKDLGNGSSESYYTPEISMKAKTAPLFMVKASSDGKRQQQFMLEGEIKKDGPLRKLVPDLRYQRSLYVLHEGKLKNLVVYGASFSGFIDFTKVMGGRSSSSVVIELSTRREKTGAVTYFPIVFTPKDPVDLKALEPTLKQLANWFDEFDRRVASQRKERAEQASIDRGDGPIEEAPAQVEKVPTNKTMSEEIKDDDEEKVDLKDIPF